MIHLTQLTKAAKQRLVSLV